MMTFSAIYNDVVFYQYDLDMSTTKTIGDAGKVACQQLKKRKPQVDLTKVEVFAVRYKENGRQQVKAAKLDELMQSGYELELQSCWPLDEQVSRQEEQEECQRLLLKPLVISLASTFMGRVLSGEARSPSESIETPAMDFIKEPENHNLVNSFIEVAKLDYTAIGFVGFADANRKLRNDEQHVTLDSDLIKKAKQLKKAGAIRLLRNEYGWQCDVIEHMEKFINCLNGA